MGFKKGKFQDSFSIGIVFFYFFAYNSYEQQTGEACAKRIIFGFPASIETNTVSL